MKNPSQSREQWTPVPLYLHRLRGDLHGDGGTDRERERERESKEENLGFSKTEGERD